MAAANEQIGIAQAAYYPTLNLAAVAGLEGSSLLNWFNWPSRFWAVGPSMSETLFDGGRRRATTESARAGYDASIANYRQTVLTSFQQVEDNLVVLRELSTESVQQHEATASAEEFSVSFRTAMRAVLIPTCRSSLHKQPLWRMSETTST